ncbi:MAG TPA: hypothetical protein VKB88_29255 [Bryobacteraceae bacterium]|nr:hypothetical protein [Bryobacteraceae bacterium]
MLTRTGYGSCGVMIGLPFGGSEGARLEEAPRAKTTSAFVSAAGAVYGEMMRKPCGGSSLR